MAIPEVKSRSAQLSPCGQYRYTLTRFWDTSKPMVCWMMLNPSTADADIDDPTIRRCMHFSNREGFGSLIVVNLYAFRSTDPKVMLRMGANDARGPDNDDHVLAALTMTDMTIVAWGTPGGPGAPTILLHSEIKPYCLGTTKNGSPKHPLYLADDTPLVRWSLPAHSRVRTYREVLEVEDSLGMEQVERSLGLGR